MSLKVGPETRDLGHLFYMGPETQDTERGICGTYDPETQNKHLFLNLGCNNNDPIGLKHTLMQIWKSLSTFLFV